MLVSNIHNKFNYSHILAASNNFGKNFLPRIGGLLDIQPISDIAKIEDKNTFHRYFYAGNALSRVSSSQSPNILTIRLTSFDKVEEKENNAEVVNISEQIQPDFLGLRQSRFVENIESQSEKVDLGAAKVVISGGRALKSKENFVLLDNLSKEFDGCAIGASRAAVDAGYVPNDLQVGQTGKTVAPDLYFAIGISGAIQHVAGMKDSKVIVAINSDGDSPIFNVKIFSFSLYIFFKLFLDCYLWFSWGFIQSFARINRKN